MRLLVVSNRLPMTVTVDGDRLEFHQSSGGLVSGLSAYLDGIQHSTLDTSEYVWIGWPGNTIPDEHKSAVVQRANQDLRAHPVFISEKEMDRFYHGFCNEILWPLFHYFPSYAVYDDDSWLEYRRINERFCDAVLEIAEPDDIIWVHDYHLMLLPALLREKLPNAKIGFFLHIPFPSYEIFRLLPSGWRKPLVEGMLGADVVGFHTEDYAKYFLESVSRITKMPVTGPYLETETGRSLVKAFPMGIDMARFREAAASATVHDHYEKLNGQLGGLRTILSLDRLDYSKGILNRLLAYELFLDRHPEWHQRVTLIVNVVPSRIGVGQYQQLKRQIEEAVGRINGKFGLIGWLPISYHYRFVDFDELVAIYMASDLALITPLRDGMNLVAKEYVASHIEEPGLLILSEFAGAAQELSGAILVNPNSLTEIAEAIYFGLETDADERRERHRQSTLGVEQSDVTLWAEEFVETLSHASQLPA